MPYLKRTFPVLFLAFIPLVLNCAHRQSPGGGPDDTTGPTVRSMVPAAESVSVPTDIKITITFSEWLLPSSDKGIALFPSTPIKTRINGKRLEIKPRVRLRDSTTYHLVITSNLKDLRNNPVSRPVSIMFSTGPSLDSGTLSGCVVDPARQFLQPAVALFRAPWQAGDSGFCGPPDYLSQTDSSGLFTFEHIGTGAYYLLAFFDKNGDSRLQASGEELYLPEDSTVTVGSGPVRAVLYPGAFDTSRQSVASVKTVDNRTIVGYWKKPWDTLLCPAAPKFRLERDDTASRSMTVGYQQMPASTRFFILTDTALDSVSYRLIYTLKSVFDTAAFIDTLRIDGAAQPDTSPPSLIKALPDKQADLQPEIRFVWSEPVYFTDTLLMADTLGDSVLITGDTAVTDTSLFSVSRSLLPGRTYRIVLLSIHGKDLSGNPLRERDSTDTASIVTITTVRADSIAVSLSGGVSCLEKTAGRKWFFKPLDGPRNFTCIDGENTFRFDSIPAAKGLIGTFIDKNDNDRPDNGRLLPFVAPEPFVMFRDTVEARARWDVEGVELAPCDPCERKEPEETADSSGIEEEKEEPGAKSGEPGIGGRENEAK
ncbi:MAG: Ig-like domain-containing protein [Chitinispirillaceae bacterium]|nr:Ig-like domain-containing protein [Chitinispirillaceae bacterium]